MCQVRQELRERVTIDILGGRRHAGGGTEVHVLRDGGEVCPERLLSDRLLNVMCHYARDRARGGSTERMGGGRETSASGRGSDTEGIAHLVSLVALGHAALNV